MRKPDSKKENSFLEMLFCFLFFSHSFCAVLVCTVLQVRTAAIAQHPTLSTHTKWGASRVSGPAVCGTFQGPHPLSPARRSAVILLQGWRPLAFPQAWTHVHVAPSTDTFSFNLSVGHAPVQGQAEVSPRDRSPVSPRQWFAACVEFRHLTLLFVPCRKSLGIFIPSYCV